MASELTAEIDAVLIGMKSDLFTAIVKATTDDPWGHLPNCGYTDEEQVCGCAEWGSRLGAAIAPFVAASGLRARIEALIGGPTPPVFLSDRPNKIVRVQHRNDRLAATVTESMVKVDDVVAALRGPTSDVSSRSGQPS